MGGRSSTARWLTVPDAPDRALASGSGPDGRWVRALGAVVVGAVIAAGCGAAPGPRPVTQPDGLPTAVAAFNAGRAAMLTDVARITGAAAAIDAFDAQARQGANLALAPSVAGLTASTTGATAALGRLPADETAARRAVGGLAAAAAPTAAESAVRSVAGAAAAEVAAVARFDATSRVAWPVYAALAQAEQTWYTRANAGWYGDPTQSADAYAVARDPVEALLARTRAAFAAAAAAVSAAHARARAAVQAAASALNRP